MNKRFQILFFLSLFLYACSGGDEGTLPTQTIPVEVQTPAETIIEPTSSALPGTASGEDLFAKAREAMVSDQIEARGVSDQAVLAAMRTVPRHEFVLPENLDLAYGDHPLPIGHGQTISQPYIVALMTESLGVEAGQKVLEIGTGSGYQAAILAEMGVEVYTVEIIPELATQAKDRLDRIGYGDVEVINADGYLGWEEHAPYDAIIVTAAPDHLPQPLVNQLKSDGKIIIPIGPVGVVQTLWLFTKTEGDLKAENLGAVRFVPLLRSEP